MTTISPLVAWEREDLKVILSEQVERALSWIYCEVEEGVSARRLEQLTWQALLVIGPTLLAGALAVRCRKSTREDLKARELDEKQVRLRMDADYHVTQTTTMGKVTFPLFAYRDRSKGGVGVTRIPARRDVVPLYTRCRSSELLVEWECRLGAEMPFRRAQQALTFFTHGAVTIEDTTLARHMVAAGQLVDPSWQYKPVKQLCAILKNRARRDSETDRPIVYASTDACALRRYVDETWSASWKMANGIRLWCIDKDTDRIIHLGGEYTWGDCVEVEAIFKRLQSTGVLPSGGDYGDGLQAQIVFPTDGAPWIKDRILPMFPGAIGILDVWHLMERLAKEAAEVFGKGTADAKEWYADTVEAVFGGRRDKKERTPKKRRGHKKSPPGTVKTRPPSKVPLEHDSTRSLLDIVADTWPGPKEAVDYEVFVRFITENVGRLRYAELRRRGFQIGSGAMEALHPVACQSRLKLPGARWLERSSHAIFGLRMMTLVGRWDEFWEQPDLGKRLTGALNSAQQA